MQRPLRIALVTYFMHIGGVETYLLRLGRYLHRLGCEVEIITTVEPGPWFHQIEQWQLQGRHIKKLRTRHERLHAVHVGIRLAMGRYDVIFLNHAAYAQHALCLLPDQTVVIPVLHNHHPQIYQVAGEHPALWNVAVAVSPRVRDTFRVQVPDRPVVYISNGVDLPGSDQLLVRRKHETPLRLLFLGQVAHQSKGVKLLPEIMRECVNRGLDVQLGIAGDGPDRAEVERLTRVHGLQGRIRFHGFVSPETAYALLLDSHLLLLPSFYEGFGLVLIEAQACGCVPIVTHLEGITDVAVEQHRTGFLVAPGDIHGFADVICELDRNALRWNEMSRAGQERVARQFSTELMGKAYLELIHDACNGRYPLEASRRRGFPLTLLSPVTLP